MRDGDLMEGGDDREVALCDKDRRPVGRRSERSEGCLEGLRGSPPALVALGQLNGSRPSPTSKASGGGTRGGVAIVDPLFECVADDRRSEPMERSAFNLRPPAEGLCLSGEGCGWG